MPVTDGIAGVVLAGGLARRMGGGDKCLRLLAGRPLLGHIVERVRPQVGVLAINANGDPERFADFGLPVVADSIDGFAGPLAGVLAGMEWAVEAAPDCSWLASFPGDSPFLPRDLVARFVEAIERDGADMACAASNGRAHPVAGLWPVRLVADLRRAMVEEEIRKVDIWTARYRLATVNFDADPIDPFFNANRPDDLSLAEQMLGRR
ncbi:MAG: molybdenum cofactor guanylyltransferase MobA [Alphaproteobacteria bacterium]|nr:molybdenum cofactor guanylyltransferase MobA [Alphaproteobacteria bacterium]